MIILPNYEICSLIYQSNNSLVYRGLRKSDNFWVILKVFCQKYPTIEELTRYEQEYQICKNLKVEGAINAYEYHKSERTKIIIFEDFQAQSLDLWLKSKQITLKDFLQISIKVTKALGEIHAANIIHKDINPSNIVINPETGQLKIIDFGISTLLSKEYTQPQKANILEGTLAYISPEQTGRMNRTLDYRTDFYSLGITFYQLLTGNLPFNTNDSLELIHCHIAKQAIPPHQINSEIPKSISDIVIKLISKNVEDRYQSSLGIQLDLEKCLEQLQTKGNILHFEIGTQDFSNKLQINQKLYGREKEIKLLLKTFEQVKKGYNQLMLISGNSGIGKSVLAKEIYKPITSTQGYFISGKFAQYQRSIPYIAIIQAFKQLIDQLLTETQEQLEKWKEKLLLILKENIQLIIEVIPDIEKIVGQQKPIASLASTQKQNRFKLAIQNFVKIFAQREHPLVIFLDDLQWADMASLDLISLLVTTNDIPHLFLIGAYRNNEVNATHPLMTVVEKIRFFGITIHQIELLPLDFFNVNKLIAESLNCCDEKVQELTELVMNKTLGNPFFINQFMQSLFEENLLFFNEKSCHWCWNLNAIKAKNITDNVVDLLSKKIKKFKKATQQILKYASCIGNIFEIKTLSIVSKKTFYEVAILLEKAILEGLIIPLDNNYKSAQLNIFLEEEIKIEYKFAHDKIQQSVYSLIDKSEKPFIHKEVGDLLLLSTSNEQLEEKIFDIVNQLNLAKQVIKNQKEYNKLAKLNLIAGKKALSASAYESAFNYLSFGISLLGLDSWNTQYKITQELYAEAIEAAYLSSNRQQMEIFGKKLLQKAETSLDKMKFYQLKLSAYIAESNYSEAIKTGILALRRFKIFLPLNYSVINVYTSLFKTKLFLFVQSIFGKPIEKLIVQSESQKHYKTVKMQLLDSLGVATYLAASDLFALVVLKGIRLTLKYQDITLYLRAYIGYGAFLIGVFNDIESGYKYGSVALKVCQSLNLKKQKGNVLGAFNNLIAPWKEHLRDTLDPLLTAYQLGIENGELEYASTCIMFRFYSQFFLGIKLNFIQKEISDYIDVLKKFQEILPLKGINLLSNTISQLYQKTTESYTLSTKNDELYLKTNLKEQKESPLFLFLLFFNKGYIDYCLENYLAALNDFSKAKKYIKSVMSQVFTPIYYYYESLIILKCPDINKKNNYLKIVSQNQHKMKKWAHYALMNYQHKYDLVEAELYRVKGKREKAA